MKSHPHPLYKIILVGDSNVGKTSIMNKFVKDTFEQNMISTIGVDFEIKQIIAKNQTISMQIWDTAGQERFRSLTHSYYRGADAVILVFNLQQEESLSTLDRWISDIKEYTSENVPIVLVGNKLDVIKIDEERVKKIAELLKLKLFLTSAKNANNINNVFEFIGEVLVDNKKYVVRTKKKTIVTKIKEMRKKTCC